VTAGVALLATTGVALLVAVAMAGVALLAMTGVALLAAVAMAGVALLATGVALLATGVALLAAGVALLEDTSRGIGRAATFLFDSGLCSSVHRQRTPL
jgi:hypothetical protein